MLLKKYGAFTICLSARHLVEASDKNGVPGQPSTSSETDFASDGGVAASTRSSKPYLHPIGQVVIHLPSVEEGQHEP